MKALIIEDEVMAAKTLKKLLLEVSPGIEIVGILESIEDSVEWIANHPMPDLMFMDIHLADGSSFAIFDRVTITCPVIFTTAY
ncbi:MAG: DNA-binding response regulator, partial [Prevotella sp.]|nr:DNA-binding response regulator [Prevotella sp.]